MQIILFLSFQYSEPLILSFADLGFQSCQAENCNWERGERVVYLVGLSGLQCPLEFSVVIEFIVFL